MKELIQQGCFWGMVLCGALSVWPFRFARRWKSWNLHLPIIGLVLYGLFEMALPPEVDVAGKMRVIVPLQLFLWLNGMAKVGIFVLLQQKSGGSRRRMRRLPQRRLQSAAALPILAACGYWFWSSLS